MRDIITKLEELNVEKQLNEGLGDMAHEVEKDHEVQMARSDLYKTAKYAVAIHKMLKDVSEMEGIDGWVQAKITKAADYLGAVKHHMEGEIMQDVELAVVPVAGDMTDAMTMPQESIEEVHEADGDLSMMANSRDRVENTYAAILQGVRGRGPAEESEVGDYIPSGMTSAEIMKLIDMLEPQGYDKEFLMKDLAPMMKEDKLEELDGPVSTHDVQKGDTLYSLAKKHNTSVDQLKQMNRQDDDKIKVGQKLNVPDTEKVKEEDVIGDIIGKLGQTKAGQKTGKDVIGDIIAKLPKDKKDTGPAVSAVTKQKAANKMALPKARPDRSMAQDTTVSLDKDFSMRTAKANQKAMQTNSKFSEWSKK